MFFVSQLTGLSVRQSDRHNIWKRSIPIIPYSPHPTPPLLLPPHPGLAHLHAHGIAYRNLKPENVLIDSGGRAKLSDMKYAKQLPFRDAQGRLHYKTFTVCGIADYLAPGTACH